MNLPDTKEMDDFYNKSRELNELKKTKISLLEYKNTIIKDKVDNGVIIELNDDIAAVEEEISKRISEIDKRKTLVKKSINRISDKVAVVAGRLHYINGLPWSVVAYTLKDTTEDSVRARFYRGMRNLEKEGK